MKYLIMGATSDMALAYVDNLLLEGGHEIVLCARNSKRLQPYQKNALIKHNTEIEIVELDADELEMHDRTLKKLPFLPDVAIIFWGYLGDQEKAQNDWEEIERIFTINLFSVISFTNKLTQRLLDASKKATIASISSVAGERGRQSNFYYGSAKAALNAYLSGMRNRYASSNIHFITVKPGFVYTKMTEHLKLPPLLTAKPKEVAKTLHSAIKTGKNTVYVKPIWRAIMYLIKSIPEGIFKKLKL